MILLQEAELLNSEYEPSLIKWYYIKRKIDLLWTSCFQECNEPEKQASMDFIEQHSYICTWLALLKIGVLRWSPTLISLPFLYLPHHLVYQEDFWNSCLVSKAFNMDLVWLITCWSHRYHNKIEWFLITSGPVKAMGVAILCIGTVQIQEKNNPLNQQDHRWYCVYAWLSRFQLL